jgi:hypothetical protein
MGTALLRALVFAVSAALILVLWELSTFDLPRLPVSVEWKARASAQLVLLAAVVAAGFAGSAVGFALLPAGTALRRKAAVALGFVFAVLVFVVLPFATAAGLAATSGATLLLAACVAYVGGRAFSVRV